MATEAQILANRRNAQKSTGPRSRQGRITVSQNAVKHGLTVRQDIISSESQADFELYRDQMLSELDPASPMESMLAERIVSLSWRLKRAGRMQNQTIDAMNADNKSNPLAKLAQSIFLKGTDQPKDGTSTTDGELALGRLAIKDFSNARVLERLLMYERRIEHSLYKTILELQRLHIMRRLGPLKAGAEETDSCPPYPQTITHSLSQDTFTLRSSSATENGLGRRDRAMLAQKSEVRRQRTDDRRQMTELKGKS